MQNHTSKSGELLETPNATGEGNQQPSPNKGKVQRLLWSLLKAEPERFKMLKTKRTVSILTGMVLGDGHLRKPSVNDKSVSLIMRHCARQKEYLAHKTELLNKIFGKKINIHEINNNGYPGVSASFGHPYFRSLRKFMYPGGGKFISKKVLNRLTPEGIAIWYMDDGSLALHKKNGYIHSREIYLNTYTSMVEAAYCRDFFKENFDIDFRISPSKGKHRLICNSKNSIKFVNIVKPYIIPTMEYKIDLKYKYPANIAKAQSTSARHALAGSVMI